MSTSLFIRVSRVSETLEGTGFEELYVMRSRVRNNPAPSELQRTEAEHSERCRPKTKNSLTESGTMVTYNQLHAVEWSKQLSLQFTVIVFISFHHTSRSVHVEEIRLGQK